MAACVLPKASRPKVDRAPPYSGCLFPPTTSGLSSDVLRGVHGPSPQQHVLQLSSVPKRGMTSARVSLVQQVFHSE